jgi:chromosome segregation protein
MTSRRPLSSVSQAFPAFRSRKALPLLVGMVTLGMCGVVLPAVAVEAPSTPDAATVALEQLRAANVARSELAHEESAWKTERERLQAAIAATRAEVARLERDAAEAEAQRDNARTKLAAISATSDLDTVRTRLSEAGVKLRTALKALAATVPPGAIAAPAEDLAGEAAFDAAVRALRGIERSAGTLGVEVVSGTRGGQTEAVKLLRVAGAAAWWVALDGSAAGTARVSDGKLQLDATSNDSTRLAITAALAQAEGRAHPTVLLLPAPARTGGQP